MRTIKWFSIISCLLLLGLSNQTQAAPLGTAFTYQGYLKDNNNPANGLFDFQLIMYNAETGGAQVGTTQNKDDVQVANGFFMVTIDFGNVFLGDLYYLEISVRPGSSTGTYTILSPRQALTPSPNSIYASNASNALTLNGQYSSEFASASHTHTFATKQYFLEVLESAPSGTPNSLTTTVKHNFCAVNQMSIQTADPGTHKACEIIRVFPSISIYYTYWTATAYGGGPQSHVACNFVCF